MDEYLAYSRHVEVLNHGIERYHLFDAVGGVHSFAAYFLLACKIQELDLESVAKATASLKMDTKVLDAFGC
ncbi:hypothetical protein H257_17199 [Aphanomyces astaci]|uniref:Uncharacterized protein n=1 Tax=Aphanomyces astaci TaxID=112090 RepID=W4FHJ4_APHAT|nr:hypothetical protein H257_17199 [Aphanomyces astaci]ETV66296.1 hypothetical protein H257_17199 [Aphanomyces astaci]|eukprot:XP_009844202.1 hypothetical protein H257_17199 [Aphanomyces astaci]